MVKHIQTICRLLPTNYLSVFEHFVGLALKELKWKNVFKTSEAESFAACYAELRQEISHMKCQLTTHITFFSHHSFSSPSLEVINEILEEDYVL